MAALESKDARCGGCGAPSGELFVRVTSATITSEGGALHDARPFLLHELLLPARSKEQQVEPWTHKIALARRLRAQTKARREAVVARWKGVQTAVANVESGPMAIANTSANTVCEKHAERYADQFLRLEQLHNQFVMQNVLRFYALLEAERAYIDQWMQREDAVCQDLLKQTQQLFHFNLFATQLESETSGQVRMWRLPASDSQHQRCVKAATENMKRGFFGSCESQQQQQQEQQLEVLDVFKIENRPLLHHFHCFTHVLPVSEVKIKGLFCTVPSESIEHCVVWGMHLDEKSFQTSTTEAIEVFNRPSSGSMDDAPGTSHEFRARLKVRESKALKFPRRFSRYSTFEETRDSLEQECQREAESSSIQYLALCRVAMGKTVRVKRELREKEDTSSLFPDDPLVGTLYFADEEEYLVRYPQAVVPEFLVQLRWSFGSNPSTVPGSAQAIIPVNLADASIESLSAGFEKQIELSSAMGNSASGLLCSYAVPDTYTSIFSGESSEEDTETLERQLVTAAARRRAAALDKLSAESVLAVCARQKKLMLEDLRSLQRVFWVRSHELWGQSSATDKDKSSNRRDQRQQQNVSSDYAKLSSTKASKLLGEVDRARQQENAIERSAAAPAPAKPKPKRNPNARSTRSTYSPIK